MGSAAYNGLIELDIKPIVTDIRTIDEAIGALITGSIVNRKDRIH